MHLRKSIIWTTAVLLVGVSAARAQEPFALRSGDRVVFFGDSITDQRLYTTFVETYVVTRFPDRNISMVHSGWGGDRVNGGGGGPIDVRIWRDVLPFNPTVITVMLGMNDGRYRAFEQPLFDDYTTGFKHIVDAFKRQLPNARITLMQPSPYDDVTRAPMFEGGYNQVLVRYGEFLKELAADQKLGLADINTPVVEALKKANAADAANAAKIIPDRVHPGAAGHLLLAEALLKAWNAPALVAGVEIDAARKEASRQRNSRVSDLHFAARDITWTETDEALPMPLDRKDPLVALVLQSSDFMQALNQEPLSVRGLAAGQYTLKIDDEAVGSFAADQLAQGINLADLPTPMARQAADVHTLTLRHNSIHAARWRQVQVPLEKETWTAPHLAEALDAMDKLERDLIGAQRTAALPRPRHFALVRE